MQNVRYEATEQKSTAVTVGILQMLAFCKCEHEAQALNNIQRVRKVWNPQVIQVIHDRIIAGVSDVSGTIRHAVTQTINCLHLFVNKNGGHV